MLHPAYTNKGAIPQIGSAAGKENSEKKKERGVDVDVEFLDSWL